MLVFNARQETSRLSKLKKVATATGILRWCLVLLVLLVSTMSASKEVLGQTPAYDILLLDVPDPDIKYSIPTALDEWGNVVGNYRTLESSTKTGFYYDRQSDSFVFCEPGQVLTDINSFGQLVGGDQAFEPDAYFWAPKRGGLWVGGQALFWEHSTAVPEPLRTCEGHVWTGAAAINNLGLIVGLSYPNFYGVPAPICAAVWHAAPTGVGLPLELPALPGHLFVAAEGISEPNGNGVCTVVGQSGSAIFGDVDEVAVRWKVKIKSNGTLVLNEGPVVLGMPPDESPVGSTAYAATTKAFVTGTMGHDAFKKSNNGTARLLKQSKYKNLLPQTSAGMAIDELKNIVGYQSYTGLSPLRLAGDRATLWPNGKAPIDLNTTVELPNRYRLFQAIDINSFGEILAYWAKEGGGSTARAVILIPKN